MNTQPVDITLELSPNMRGDTETIKPAAKEHDALIQKVFPGMYLCGVGDFDCDGKGLKEVIQAIKDAPRPVVLTCALPDLTRTVEGSEQLQIQSAVNALQDQVRDELVELKHLRHEMSQRDAALAEHTAQVNKMAAIFKVAAGQT